MWIGAQALTMLAAVGSLAHPLRENVNQLASGDLVSYDGTYYDYRAADGGQQVKVWVPPGAEVVRGLIVSGHGGGSGDSRAFVRDRNLKALAARYDFGLVGLHRFPGRQVAESGAANLIAALGELSRIGSHPELAHAPFVVFGSSNGGSTAYGLAAGAPDRTICFVSNVMTRFNPEITAPAAHGVPGVFIIGQYDRLMGGEASVEPFRESFETARAQGALWSLVIEAKGHEDGSAFDVFAALMDRAIAARLPAGADPRSGPVPLRSLAGAPAWHGFLAESEAVPPAIAAGDDHKGSWLIDEGFAKIWQAAATRNNAFRLVASNVKPTTNPNVDPRTMFSIGAPVVEPGSRIELSAETADLGSWTQIEFFEGVRPIGAMTPGGESVVFEPNAERVLALTAVATLADGSRRIAQPVHFAVLDRSLPLLSQAELAAPPAFRPSAPSGSAVSGDYRLPAELPEHTLVSYGLNAVQESSFGRGDDLASFWSQFTDRHSAIRLDCENHAREGSEFSIVTTADARMTVRAAHSARGLYLLFEILDNRFEPAAADVSRYPERDAIDLLIDRNSSLWINAPENVRWATNLDWGLWLTSRQIQIAIGEPEPPEQIKINEADPFDMPFDQFKDREAMRRERGIVVRTVRHDPLRRSIELFLPWAEVGAQGGLPSEPSAGTRLAFSPTYNDGDPGEDRKTLCWVDNKTPWNFAAQGGEAPRGWGDILIGPMLSD